MKRNQNSYKPIAIRNRLDESSVHLLVLESVASNDVFLALGRVKVDGQFDALGLVDTKRQI